MANVLGKAILLTLVSGLASCVGATPLVSSTETDGGSALISSQSSESYIPQESSSEVSTSNDASSSSSATSQAPIYDEPADSMEGLDPDDMSGLYNPFRYPITNYTSSVTTYFGDQGLKDYYRRHKHNYIQEKTSIFTSQSMYSYARDDAYFPLLNIGYLNLYNNITSFELPGSNISERLSHSLTEADLSLVKESDSYRNNLFTLEDLNETYFVSYGFKRVSKRKYQYDRQFDSAKDNVIFRNFLDIVAPYFENDDMFMTFSKITIEVNPLKDVSFRIRLYAYSTDYGKLIKDHWTQDYPNWYLLFSETLITDIGSTQFYPANALLGK